MVQDLKTQQSNNVVLDLSALGEAANQSINREQQEKPLLEKPTIATTESCTLRVMTNDLKSNREDPKLYGEQRMYERNPQGQQSPCCCRLPNMT